MADLRGRWEGSCLSGDYKLEQWLGGDDAAAFFQTSLTEEGRRAVVKLAPEAAADGAGPLELWRRTRQLRHPNLIELLDCGRAEQDGETVLYAVFESPDETLASALERSPLDPRESREVLDSVLSALRYLHAQGLVAGAIDPGHVVAVGDRIKLSTGAVRYAKASADYREDVRLLGELWRQALTPASPESSEIAAHALDPNPQTRWTLAEIGAALEDARPQPAEPSLAPPGAPPPPAPGPPVSLSAAPASEANYAGLRPALPARAVDRAPAYGFRRWIFVGAAAVLLLILGLNRQRSPGASAQSQVASAAPAAGTPAPVPKAAEPAASEHAPAAGDASWRVVAFTYRTRDAAARKAQQLNRRHPGLHAAVFAAGEKRGRYLVSLGGRMTHEEALRLQRSARDQGLPRDLYVQNFSE